MTLQVESRLAAFWFLFLSRCGRGTFRRIHLRLEGLQILLDFGIAGSDQVLVMTKRFERLAEREQMLAPVVSNQRFGNGVFASLDSPIAECCERARVALACQDRLDDR